MEGTRIIHIELSTLADGLYKVALRYQDEVVTGDFTIHVGIDRIEQIMASVWNASELKPVRKGTLEGLDPVAELGRSLFAALFDTKREAFLRVCQNRASESGQGLRLLFTFQDQKSTATLPWEFLYDERKRDFLALATSSPVVRSLASHANPLLPSQSGLRVLAVTSDLEFSQGRWKAMTNQLYKRLQKDFEQLQYTIVEDITLPRLVEALFKGPFDIVHFSGHADKVLGEHR